MKKYLFLGLIITSLIIPTIVSAGDLKGPLVPCGTSTTEPCTFCHLFVLAQTIIDFITTGIFILAVLFIVIGGLIILFAGAVPSNLELGKKIITNAVIGVVIALLAWTVINMIFNTLISTDENKFPAPWNDIKCQGGEVTPPTGKNLYCHIIQRIIKTGPNQFRLLHIFIVLVEDKTTEAKIYTFRWSFSYHQNRFIWI